MNEQKRSFEEYKNPEVSEQKLDATDLSLQMTSFLRSVKVSPSDWILVDKLIKQINKPKYNVSRKVFRSVQRKFETVQDKYQRG